MGLRDLSTQAIDIKSDNFKFFFSLVFALFVLFFYEVIYFLRFLTDLILLPFTLLHEFGHYFSAILLIPSCNPQIYTNFGDNGVSYAQLSTNGLPICLNSVLVMLAGSFILLICILGILFLSRSRKSPPYLILRNFLLFVLLSDLPNLFPILPTYLGALSDGYSAWIYLHVLISLPFPTMEFSVIWSSFASIMIIFSYYCLGLTIYHLITYLSPKFQLQLQKTTENVS